MANLLGCTANMKTAVTGITLVAVGTSLPDTFASRTAALQDETADNSIGNVNGSNSVNVFLGLGLPWILSSGYAALKGRQYCIYPENLTESVIVYLGCASLCLGILFCRRMAFGGELGGSRVTKWISGLLISFLWVGYVVFSILKVYGVITWSYDVPESTCLPD
ncbi:unnamed protein product [Protopolystoma xenopodis]|uniref:Sodium/calcium exchanger membrane region domain-containing protein n=1 Tax=Protopolystoma xenopodis TaxID=117903 RepID=A0A3S4ZYF1_9PLAT|nr:unnamed protein product [Protopolystoma xenopodis]